MCPQTDAFNFERNDFDEEEQQIPAIRGLARSERRKKRNKKKQNLGTENLIQEPITQLNEDTITFTYQASRYEAGWLEKSLGGFYQQHWI